MVERYAAGFVAKRNTLEAKRLKAVIKRLEALADSFPPLPADSTEPSPAQQVRDKIRTARESEAVGGQPTSVVGGPSWPPTPRR